MAVERIVPNHKSPPPFTFRKDHVSKPTKFELIKVSQASDPNAKVYETVYIKDFRLYKQAMGHACYLMALYNEPTYIDAGYPSPGIRKQMAEDPVLHKKILDANKD